MGSKRINIFLFARPPQDAPTHPPSRGRLAPARLELRDQRLRVERVVGQQIRGGFGEVPTRWPTEMEAIMYQFFSAVIS